MPELIDQSREKLVGMMVQLVNDSREANKVVYVRFLEVAIELALKSERLCQQIARPVIAQVFQDFFKLLDILTQVTVMDFVVKLAENEYGIKMLNEQNFIHNLFEQFGGSSDDSFGFLSSNMLLVGAKLYSVDAALFNPFENKNYMSMLR